MGKKNLANPVFWVVLFGLILSLICTPTNDAQAKQKEITIGAIAFFGWPVGLDMVRGVELMAEMDNQKGGIDIGGEKYRVKIIQYDTKHDQAQAVAAANRLIFKDKVNYIISDPIFLDAWLPIADKNKVVAVVMATSMESQQPKYTYLFSGAAMNAMNSVLPGWFGKTYPDKKQIVVGLPDTKEGHTQFPTTKKALAAAGLKAESLYYPQGQQDLSALGTKVKTMNPDAFLATSGGPIGDGLCFRAVYQAGYRGQLFAFNPAPLMALSKVIPAEALEGFINMAWPMEFENPPTEQARAVKAAWIEKYGKWEGPEFIATANYACIRAALKKAGTTDVDKVAEVIASGLEYEGPTGRYRMIDRPDIGNSRTVDSICEYYFKRVEGGKPVQIHHVTFDEALGYFRNAFK